jgi:hypothetical protein
MDDEPTLYLPSAAELALAYPAPACGALSSPMPRVNDEVLVFSDMGVMTNVHVSDPRRQELLKNLFRNWKQGNWSSLWDILFDPMV